MHAYSLGTSKCCQNASLARHIPASSGSNVSQTCFQTVISTSSIFSACKSASVVCRGVSKSSYSAMPKKSASSTSQKLLIPSSGNLSTFVVEVPFSQGSQLLYKMNSFLKTPSFPILNRRSVLYTQRSKSALNSIVLMNRPINSLSQRSI